MIRVYIGRPAADGGPVELGHLELGRPPRIAPGCDLCRRPANLEVADRAWCAPCLEAVALDGDEVMDLKHRIATLERERRGL